MQRMSEEMEMESSIILARIIGPYLLIVGIGFLFNIKTVQKIIKDFDGNEALIYLGGILALLLGLIMVTIHNVWEVSWIGVVTLVGWIALIKGAALLICPHQLLKATAMFHKGTAALIVHVVIVIVLGAILTAGGFFLA